MTAYNCPMCELRFASRNERDWHLRKEHEHMHVHPPTERPLDWSRPRHPHPADHDGEADRTAGNDDAPSSDRA